MQELKFNSLIRIQVILVQRWIIIWRSLNEMKLFDDSLNSNCNAKIPESITAMFDQHIIGSVLGGVISL